MTASIFIIAVSLVLFHYWFRYTCVLILSTKTVKDFSADVVEANQLSFLRVQTLLKASGGESLGALEELIERDYRLVTYLMGQAAEFHVGGSSPEQIMLRIDFRLMKCWYALTHRVSDSRARAALAEMAEIVGHFANAFGEQLSVSARA
jgi:hypothetical protein